MPALGADRKIFLQLPGLDDLTTLRTLAPETFRDLGDTGLLFPFEFRGLEVIEPGGHDASRLTQISRSAHG
jgi:hypothetical protein